MCIYTYIHIYIYLCSWCLAKSAAGQYVEEEQATSIARCGMNIYLKASPVPPAPSCDATMVTRGRPGHSKGRPGLLI